MKCLAFFDLDKTIFNDISFHSLCKFQVEQGVLPKDFLLETSRAQKKYLENKIIFVDLAAKMLNIYAREAKGKKFNDFYNNAVDFFKKESSLFYDYFEEILPKLKETHEVYLITTNMGFMAAAVKDKFDLDGYVASELEVENGKFNGNVEYSLAGQKDTVVNLMLEKYTKKNSIAMGDSEDDVEMLKKVENPILINPSRKVLEMVPRNWAIVTEDTASKTILEILGDL